MNPDIKEKWLNLLRSEEYEQGNGQLGYDPPDGTPARRCCLGVLCEVAVQEGVIEKKVINGDVIYGVNLAVANSISDDVTGVAGEDWESAKFYLPKAVREWAGLSHYSPTVPRPDGVDESLTTDYRDEINLATLNDSVVGYGFPEIADQVERHL